MSKGLTPQKNWTGYATVQIPVCWKLSNALPARD